MASELRKRKNYDKIKYIIAAVMAMIMLFIAILACGNNGVAFADSEHSGALADLQTDDNFIAENYEYNADDYSLKVIQIAESTDGELYIYVYQPAALLSCKATCVNMSVGVNVSDTHLYSLTLLSYDGIFQKYKVEGITVGASTVRHYNISSIYRQFIKGVDKESGKENTVSEVAFPVGQKWTATTQNGKTVYSMTDTEVVRITRKQAGFVRYPNGTNWNLSVGACDGHYVAFDTDHNIDKLLSAKIYFTTRKYNKKVYGEKESDPEEQEVIIVDGEIAQNAPAFNGTPVKWDRIQTGRDFATALPDNTSDEDRAVLATYQHVLSFYETTYTADTGAFGWAVPAIILGPLVAVVPALVLSANASGTYVNDVSVLELTFEKDGQVYNLGVVDNKQSGPRHPINNNPTEGLPKWAIVLIVIGVVLIVLIVLGVIFPPFGRAMLAMFKGVGLVISAPFRAIGKAIARRRERKLEEEYALSKAEPSRKKKKGKSNVKSKKAAGKRGKK